MVCRRCRRPVEPDAVICEYCQLPNPLANRETQLAGATDGQRGNATVRRNVTLALSSLVLVGGSVSAWVVQRQKMAAPYCNAKAIVAGVVEVVRDNAVYELPPKSAARFASADFGELATIEPGPEGRFSRKRTCAAVFHLSVDSQAVAVIELMMSGGRYPDPESDGAKSVIGKWWHASQRVLEVPIQYGVAPGNGTADAKWDLRVDERGVSIVRDVVRVLAR